MTAQTLPPMGYFGSKMRLAPKIVDLLPPHRGYIEPYCGGLSVLLAKRRSLLEVANDLDGDLMTFWRILRDRPHDLARVCRLTPHSRAEYLDAWPIPDDVDDLERARLVWVKLSQSRGGAMRRTGWRYHEAPNGRTSSMPTTLASYVDRIERAAARIRHVTLECLPAIEAVDRYGRDPENLLYVDPPYLYTTRSKSSVYAHEMGDQASHRELAEHLHAVRSAVVLSGYPDPLYEDLYADWHRLELRAGTGQANAKGYQERTEVLWSNRPLRHDEPLPLDGGWTS